MKFIFPSNYKFTFKMLGFIDYKTAVFDVIYGGILFFICKVLNISITIKIYIFVGLYLPILLFTIFGLNGENIVDVLKYLLKYFLKQKIYLYSKE